MSTLRLPLPRLLRAAVLFLGLLSCFVIALTLAYALPHGRIVVNAGESVSTLRSEGLYPTPFVTNLAYRLDNFTDALMLDTAIPEPGRPALEAAMAATHGEATDAQGHASPIEALAATTAGDRENPVAYAYYWHGYQVALRPALLVFDYGQLRYVNMMLLAGLGTGVLVLMTRVLGARAALAFGVALAATGYMVVPYSLQYSTVTYLMFGALLAMLAGIRAGWFDRIHVEFFVVAGMLTAFLDLLTTPVLTLGVPLAVLLASRARSESSSLARETTLAVWVSAAWFGGYSAAWFSKWMIASVVLGENVVSAAVSQVLMRTGAEGPPIALGPMLSMNLERLLPIVQFGAPGRASFGPVDGIAIALGAVLLAVLIAFRRPWSSLRPTLAVLLVVPIPYLWFVAASNHSSVHNWFTYRIQLIALFAVGYVLLSALDLGRMRASVQSALALALGGARFSRTSRR